MAWSFSLQRLLFKFVKNLTLKDQHVCLILPNFVSRET